MRNYRGKAEAMLGKWLLAAHDLQTGQSIDFDEGTAEMQKKIKSHTDSVLRKEAKKRVCFSPVLIFLLFCGSRYCKKCRPGKIRLRIDSPLSTHSGDVAPACKMNKILAPYFFVNARRRSSRNMHE